MSPPDTDSEAGPGIFKNLPAFCLGNSPRLPDDLSCLAGQFTVGVNRILLRYEPTVLMWVDGNIYRMHGQVTEHGQVMDKSKSVLVCDSSVAHRQFHHGLHTWVGANALTHICTPTDLCCNGNTGACAARWLLALGCSPVYLAGMECKYKDGISDFYGQNQWHHRTEGDNGTLVRMQRELLRLKIDGGDRICEIYDQQHLEEVAAECAAVNQDELKAAVRAIVTG